MELRPSPWWCHPRTSIWFRMHGLGAGGRGKSMGDGDVHPPPHTLHDDDVARPNQATPSPSADEQMALMALLLFFVHNDLPIANCGKCGGWGGDEGKSLSSPGPPPHSSRPSPGVAELTPTPSESSWSSVALIPPPHLPPSSIATLHALRVWRL